MHKGKMNRPEMSVDKNAPCPPLPEIIENIETLPAVVRHHTSHRQSWEQEYQQLVYVVIDEVPPDTEQGIKGGLGAVTHFLKCLLHGSES